jgi:hypothetical protein
MNNQNRVLIRRGAREWRICNLLSLHQRSFSGWRSTRWRVRLLNAIRLRPRRRKTPLKTLGPLNALNNQRRKI